MKLKLSIKWKRQVNNLRLELIRWQKIRIDLVRNMIRGREKGDRRGDLIQKTQAIKWMMRLNL